MIKFFKKILGLVKCGRCGDNADAHVQFDRYRELGCQQETHTWEEREGQKRIKVTICKCPLTRSEVYANYG